MNLDDLRRRFMAKVSPEPTSGCWLWTGGVSGVGYGMISVGKRVVIGAHRASWLLHRGPIPEGMQLCHKCDVRCCVNPDHLFVGTRSDNMQDCLRKGRNPIAKIDEEVVRRVLTLEAIGTSRRRIRWLTGLDEHRISAIASGKSWRHIFAEYPEIPRFAAIRRAERHLAKVISQIGKPFGTPFRPRGEAA